jgi:hypothetical protein
LPLANLPFLFKPNISNMKKLILSVLFALAFGPLWAQYTTADIFKTTVEITWLGVDYSDVKFIGPASGWGEVSTKSPTEMRDKYFPEWNSLIVNEWKAFKIEDAVYRTEVPQDIKAISKANEKSNKKEIFSESISDYQLLTESDVKSMVKKYDFNGKEGLGFLLIAEGMSKGKEEASYWVTFVDMKSKTVLLTKRMTGKAGGFGFRNYWAGSIKSLMKSIRKEFKTWR